MLPLPYVVHMLSCSALPSMHICSLPDYLASVVLYIFSAFSLTALPSSVAVYVLSAFLRAALAAAMVVRVCKAPFNATMIQSGPVHNGTHNCDFGYPGQDDVIDI